VKNQKNLGISFEVFPPKTTEGFNQLNVVCQQLQQLNPKYISVTFGAGGSAQEKTQAVVRHLVSNQVASTPHISCVGMTRARLTELLQEYIQLGIKRLVVVQGDLPTDHPDEARDFIYAADLVAAIREIGGKHFHISVAAYPEFHPRAQNPTDDLANFKKKIEAGADSAITQFFYNSDAYIRFLESCHQLNINIPIIPGIMPIENYQKLSRFAVACGAEIPLWLRKRLDPYVGDPLAMKTIGIEIVTKLCERLVVEGVKGMHFYTLNQFEPTSTIINYLR
jgi:methylenetetrahydrofolate reductase (NADPH)